MLKPSSIKGKTFDTVKNGYDTDAVHNFLGEVARDFSELLTAVEESNLKMMKLVEKINEYREDEDAIKNAMIMAQKEAAKTINDAKAEAKEMIESAKSAQIRLAERSASECDRIIREHKEKCETLIKENTEMTEMKIKMVKKSYETEKARFDKLMSEVTYFKANLVDLYNKQLHLIMEMPDNKDSEQDYADEEVVANDNYSSNNNDSVNYSSNDVADNESAVEAYAEIDKKDKVDEFFASSSEPVIPKENLSDLKFGKNN